VQTTLESEGYPRLLRRLRGLFIDGIIVPLTALGTLLALVLTGLIGIASVRRRRFQSESD